MNPVLQTTPDQFEYLHDTGELSKVFIELAGMGTRKIGIANLPPEINERVIRDAISTYGEVKEVREEVWSKAYRYAVSNWVRISLTCLKNIYRPI
jgi:hypothetical protein